MKVGVEVGGTFTDLILVDNDGVVTVTGKVFSTPSDPSEGVLRALGLLAGQDLHGVPLSHGSTVATNAVLERRGPRVGFLVTEGVEDILELQRQDRDTIYDLHYQKPRPLVSRDLVRGVPERLDAAGEVVRPLDEAAVRQAVDALVAEGVTSLAVCLLHSYRNPAHEERIKAIVEAEYPQLSISLSSEVIPEFREYERSSTTTVDAFVRPVVGRYLAHLEREVGRLGLPSPWMMQSNGGLLPASYAAQHAVRTLYSGPAAGVTGAMTVAKAAGIEQIITMDMGGTSTDVCLVTAGQPEITTEATIDRIPIKMPMLDIVSVGAGGGSIAWLDTGGMLQVGPHSAGAEPGPVCYGRGGTLPTTTDANVVRGLIRPQHFLGDQLTLNRAAATDTLNRFGREVGRSGPQLAEDIFRIASTTMAGAIRIVSVERGYDPRDYTLVAYGGAGPLHAATVADDLNIGRVLVPPYPGLMSAYGLLVADFQRDFARTGVRSLEGVTTQDVLDAFASLRADALREVAGQGISINNLRLSLGADMRYRGQGFELTVPIDWADLEADGSTWLAQRFHELHRIRYGHATPGEPVELVTYRLAVVGTNPKPAALRVPAAESRETETLPVVIGGEEVPCAFVWRAGLPTGFTANGPVVVEEETATTFVPSGWRLTVDDLTNLLLERG